MRRMRRARAAARVAAAVTEAAMWVTAKEAAEAVARVVEAVTATAAWVAAKEASG